MAGVEIKCPSSKVHLEYLLGGEVPAQYVPQVQFQILVMDWDHCDFVSYDPRLPGHELFVVRAMPDERMAAQLRAWIEDVVQLQIEALTELGHAFTPYSMGEGPAIVEDVEQGSPQWLAMRRGAITASKADRLTTPAKRRTLAFELLAERLSDHVEEQFVSTAMAWGIEHEAEALARYELDQGVSTRRIGFAWAHGAVGWVGCSPDAEVA